jgi:hypothetical protein
LEIMFRMDSGYFDEEIIERSNLWVASIWSTPKNIQPWFLK